MSGHSNTTGSWGSEPTPLTTPEEPSNRGRDEEHPQNTEASENKTGMGQEGL